MAAQLETHVQLSEADTQPQCEDDDQSDGEGGSSDEGSVDGGEEDSDGEGGSDGEGSADGGDGGSDDEGSADGGDGGSDDEGSADGGDGGSDDEGSADGGDGGSDGEEAEDEDGERDDGNANAGWAEAMAKILGKKTPESQTTILVKNKVLDKKKEKERKEQLERKKQIDKKRTWEMMSRVKPDIVKDREGEKSLQRIATRGVVQLFNAVRKHQKTIDTKVKEVGSSERKKVKILSSVSKKDFIDVLRRTEGVSAAASKTEKTAAAATDEKPAWSVLTDDFMMGATMKDWDKDSDREDAGSPSRGDVEESDSD